MTEEVEKQVASDIQDLRLRYRGEIEARKYGENKVVITHLDAAGNGETFVQKAIRIVDKHNRTARNSIDELLFRVGTFEGESPKGVKRFFEEKIGLDDVEIRDQYTVRASYHPDRDE